VIQVPITPQTSMVEACMKRGHKPVCRDLKAMDGQCAFIGGKDASPLGLATSGVALYTGNAKVNDKQVTKAWCLSQANTTDNFQLGELQIRRVTIAGPVTMGSIRRTCHARKMFPLCDSSTACEHGKSLSNTRGIFSKPTSTRSAGVPIRVVRGAFIYAEDAKQPLLNTGLSSDGAISLNAAKNGDTLCAEQPASYTWGSTVLLTVWVNETLNSKTIVRACAAAKLEPVCDNPAAADGGCVLLDDSLIFSSQTASNTAGIEDSFMQGLYLYRKSGTAGLWGQGKSAKQATDSPGGYTLCVKSRSGTRFSYGKVHLLRTKVPESISNAAIKKACALVGMKPACNRNSARLTNSGLNCTIVVNDTWTLTDRIAGEKYGIPWNRLRGACLYDKNGPQMAIGDKGKAVGASPFGGDTMCALETENFWPRETAPVLKGAKVDSADSGQPLPTPLIPFVARDVRIYPLTFTGSVPSMRVDFFGSTCTFCRDNSVGITSGILPSDRFVASSIMTKVEGPENARLFGRSAWRSAQFFSCAGGHKEGDNCFLQIAECKPTEPKGCFLRPILNLPFNSQVRKAPYGRFFSKKEGKVKESLLPLVWKLAWSAVKKQWVASGHKDDDAMPILRWNHKKSTSPEVCLSREAMAATSYIEDPEYEATKFIFRPENLGKCKRGMGCYRARPNNSTLQTLQKTLLENVVALKAKGLLVPQEYSKQYLELNFCPKDGKSFKVCDPTHITAIATQGNPIKVQSYVSQYAISYTEDGANWKWLGEFGKKDGRLSKALLFRGNNDQHTVSKQYLPYKIKAQAIRLHPTCWSSNTMSLRVEIYSCVVDFDWKPVVDALKTTGPRDCDKLMPKAMPSFKKWTFGNGGSGAVFQTEPRVITSLDNKGNAQRYEMRAYQKRVLSSEGLLVKSLLCHTSVKKAGSSNNQKTACCTNKAGTVLREDSHWATQSLDTMML